ncbi:hypothetical protein HFO09_09010 [Rhizobium laguerreae]|uniref:helix-turn-helix transcriptional regulator n=1 Tax=Rhizobium laguerreae TaxID=1076926 RepID=UPI001C923583|nr:hypothetical protein [Rhizobium laguerreae]MBY3259868.1 hypothetical protein [Rhizobium laguerreae]MBY3282861.1 hypothetical protein [Rhizobium laguerreae]MBY3289215.1 hypothetical protein [Rhizobium laguerreae]
MAGATEEWAVSVRRAETREFGRITPPRLATTVAFSSALGFARAEAALEAFDIFNKAVLVLDRTGQVVLMNRSATLIVCVDVHILNRRLTCRDATARRSLDAAIHSVCTSEAGSEMSVPVRITRRSGIPIVGFVTSAGGAAQSIFSRCRAFVILIDPMDRRVPSPELLQQIFPLTPTEARLAHFLTKGRKLHELSMSGGYSYETGRNHLKSIFAKIGVNSQSDLVATLGSLA